MFSTKAQKFMKSSPSIWHYVVSVKLTVNISPIFVAFLENMNFKSEEAWKNDYHIIFDLDPGQSERKSKS